MTRSVIFPIITVLLLIKSSVPFFINLSKYSLFNTNERNILNLNQRVIGLKMMGITVRNPPTPQSGVVLVSQPGEHNHYLYQQTVFIYEYNQRGSKGVILERPTAFNMGEMSPGMLGDVFEGNTLYTGGDQGSDTAIMLHGYDIEGYARSVGGGLFVGGIKQARELILDRKAAPKDFKFFFNGVEWAPGVLEREIEQGRWDVVDVSADLVLRQGTGSTLWGKAREAINNSKKEKDQ